MSPPHGRDVSGDLPSGEISSAGQEKDPPTAGDRRGKVSSSYPPIFRAKPGESFKEWKRSVDFWIDGEASSLPPELIGPRLMAQLRDRAGQLVHHLSSRDVSKAKGPQVIMSTLEKSPIIRQLDRRKVDQHRKQLRRLPGESLESYVTRGSIYRTQLQALDEEMQMGECFYTGHLLDNAKLTRRDKVMIKTRAGSDYEDDERHDDLEGEHGFPIGSSEPNVAARHGDDFLIQREEKGRKGVNAADFEGASLYGIEEEGPHIDEKTFPPELDDAENEAFAMHFKAKQKIAEVRKLRQYFKRPDQEEKKRLLAEKMRTSPCHRCGELGHWSRECPRKGHSAGATAKPEDSEWATLVALCASTRSSRSSAGSRYKVRMAGAVAWHSLGMLVFGVIESFACMSFWIWAVSNQLLARHG